MRFTPQDEEFRADVREWLEANLTGPFAGLRGAGGPGREHEGTPNGWPGTGTWPPPAGPAWAGPPNTAAAAPRSAQQVIFHEEYARADAPARISIVGEELLGPTLIAFGTPEQRQRFLPQIKAVDRALVPGLLRTRRRLRPGRGGHPGRARPEING